MMMLVDGEFGDGEDAFGADDVDDYDADDAYPKTRTRTAMLKPSPKEPKRTHDH